MVSPIAEIRTPLSDKPRCIQPSQHFQPMFIDSNPVSLSPLPFMFQSRLNLPTGVFKLVASLATFLFVYGGIATTLTSLYDVVLLNLLCPPASYAGHSLLLLLIASLIGCYRPYSLATTKQTHL